MSLEADGLWKSGVWATTVWADGVWFEGAEAAEPVGGHYWPTKRRRRRDPLEERIEAAREAAAELRALVERAIRGEPVPLEAVAEVVEPKRAAEYRNLIWLETGELRAVEVTLARTQRLLGRYEELQARRRAAEERERERIAAEIARLEELERQRREAEARRLARIAELESYIEQTVPKLIEAGEAERIEAVERSATRTLARIEQELERIEKRKVQRIIAWAKKG